MSEPQDNTEALRLAMQDNVQLMQQLADADATNRALVRQRDTFIERMRSAEIRIDAMAAEAQAREQEIYDRNQMIRDLEDTISALQQRLLVLEARSKKTDMPKPPPPTAH